MVLFETWGRTEWVLLVVNAIAVYIVVRFLKSRVELKLREVEARQAHERLMRKHGRTSKEGSNETLQERNQ
jgi:hypothetical protein